MKSKPNLYLVGFMGTGKSTVGRQVAQRMGLHFVDSDNAIEAEQGKSIPEIFASVGEGAFREMERAFVESGHSSEGNLISCGGGLAVQPGMMDLLKSRGLVFSLIASAKGIYERTRHNSNRPLLQVEDPLAEIEKLLAVRDPIYQQAHCCILTEGRTVNEVVNHVCRSYRLEAAQRAR
ncbi:shikimate kinase [Pelagicoccus sp. SDUM812005]|uniref:shikimate kinase n=1 Tax=Pelagicoccus sp. SDUM812005 TaxID=3041257 RepID=UPI00280E7353|nr:shikimate kinase [Pelagicoccus sp. SDUM812005]MDQ8182975.1 shikimate kinase [Pelagicoccus sp. SDUM812005]